MRKTRATTGNERKAGKGAMALLAGLFCVSVLFAQSPAFAEKVEGVVTLRGMYWTAPYYPGSATLNDAPDVFQANDIIETPGVIENVDRTMLGYPTTPAYEVDAISRGDHDARYQQQILFSVDEDADGLNAPNDGPGYTHSVNSQDGMQQQAADVFVARHPVDRVAPWGLPDWYEAPQAFAGVLGAGGSGFVGATPKGLAVLGSSFGNELVGNQALLGLLPGTDEDTPYNGMDPKDDVDGFEIPVNAQELGFTDDTGALNSKVYWSEGRTSPFPGGGVRPGVSPSDILVAVPGGGISTFATPEDMGLLGFLTAPMMPENQVYHDDLDALIMYDMDRDGEMDPGVDYALFSLAPGSPSLLGMGSNPAVMPFDIDAGDVFVTNFQGTFALYAESNELGLNSVKFQFNQDNVDALDVIPIPEPGMVTLVGIGLLGLAGYRRRNAK
jgi:hypothetical protein